MAKKIMQAITKENSYGRRMVPEYLIDKLEKAPDKLVASGSIKDLTTDEINDLQAGDIVVKTTGDQKHTYIVTYKEEGQGICITYVDASLVETVSFDYVDGNWVYNSTDVTRFDQQLHFYRYSFVMLGPASSRYTVTIISSLDVELTLEGLNALLSSYTVDNNKAYPVGVTGEVNQSGLKMVVALRKINAQNEYYLVYSTGAGQLSIDGNSHTSDTINADYSTKVILS